ncbi:zinc finger and SCAN domain-containing protein 22-like [Candoia aspera]|uniref:zinc finger and SCAN domain-containing protein 22-like n=1 Tax=Candoia aspera TaxID=51853 RepID=UPI002FD81D5E
METLSVQVNMSVEEEMMEGPELKNEKQSTSLVKLWADLEAVKAPSGAAPLQQVKYEPKEGLQECWEAQWQEFLRTLQGPRSDRGHAETVEDPMPWADMKAFLASFEQVASTCRWPRDQWVTLLMPGLSGEAEEAFNSLGGQERGDYGKVKTAILRGEALARERQRQDFRQFCYQETEGPQAVYRHLQELCWRWLKAERCSKEQILELLILEQFLTVLPPEMQSWVRAHGPETCTGAVLLAEEFLLKDSSVKEEEESPGPLGMVATEDSSQGGQFSPLGSWGWQLSKETKLDMDEDVSSFGDGHGQKNQDNHLHQSTSGAPEDEILKTDITPQYCKEEMRPRNQVGAETKWKSQRSLDEAVSAGKSDSNPEEARTGHKIHQCHCGKSFRWGSNFRVHERIHTGEKPYKCTECGASFRKSAQLKAHEGIHTGEVPFRCSMCQKTFTSGSNLIVHERIHTGEKPYRCASCGKSFRQKGTLTTHEKIHMGEKPFKCLTCGKNFRQKGTLTTHEKIHLGEKPYKCPRCGKNFRTSADLRVHERIHTGVKPYWCSVCLKSFTDGSNLITHERIHTGVKPYRCARCGKSFCQKSGLMTHERVHTGVNPYRCSAGQKRLGERADLNTHQGAKLGERSQTNFIRKENCNAGHIEKLDPHRKSFPCNTGELMLEESHVG